MMTFDEANTWMYRHTNSYNRLTMLFEIKHQCARTDWLRLLGEHFTCTDNVVAFIPELQAAIGKKRPVLEMMDVSELAEFNKLRDCMCVYRGCGPLNEAGICWTLDRNVAMRFPFTNRYKVADPRLITGSVQRSQIVAFKGDRKEAEIISFDVEFRKRERLWLDDGEFRTEVMP
jgi:hypothetical protein